MMRNPKGGNPGFYFITNGQQRQTHYKSARGELINIEQVKIANSKTSESTTIVIDKEFDDMLTDV